MTQQTSFKRVWMITGASRGMGAEITAAALAQGDAVVATARKSSAITDALGSQPGLLAVNLDVTSESAALQAVKLAMEHFGRVDVLVNNAGYGLAGAVEESSAEEVRSIFDTNVMGLLNVTRAVLPRMRSQRSGHVINMSSLGGYQVGAGFGVYGSTKFAVEGLSEALHAELTPLGIHVTVVEPGYFRTDFLDSSSAMEARNVIADYAETAGKVRVSARAYSHRQPGDPKRLAQALLTLVSAENPPLRLQLGTDALTRIREKHAFVEQELQTWEALSRSTDFPV
ncbi:MAG: short-chain dehydrogenase [Caballeronia sp.]|jgi:NAD(P)-dependent dehydrogenase (short-subunit alcohol dehydrogenase family)|uniref:oxidoreductase n=1 Tax=Caballeronia sp. TaxID=1931223 RepID=UPI002623E36D|nr:oxidoreductase [Caballeronia sp.]MDB5831474.1 short-chain dehydrogenase [Caballeronia sp.]